MPDGLTVEDIVESYMTGAGRAALQPFGEFQAGRRRERFPKRIEAPGKLLFLYRF